LLPCQVLFQPLGGHFRLFPTHEKGQVAPCFRHQYGCWHPPALALDCSHVPLRFPLLPDLPRQLGLVDPAKLLDLQDLDKTRLTRPWCRKVAGDG
jgi:hypothetical protein